MKKRLKRGEVRAIKIDEEALYEFIRESLQEQCESLFDLFDQKDIEGCMHWNKRDGSFTYLVYRYKDKDQVDFSAINSTLPHTTETLFSNKRYVTIDVAEQSN